MASILTCSVPFDTASGAAVCPGTLGSTDISVFVGVASTHIDPVIAMQAFGAGLVIAGIPLIVAMVGRIIVKSIFSIGKLAP